MNWTNPKAKELHDKINKLSLIFPIRIVFGYTGASKVVVSLANVDLLIPFANAMGYSNVNISPLAKCVSFLNIELTVEEMVAFDLILNQ